ncbi:MAG: hypothetical protein ACI9W4_001133 [Rhodothermales bacterium]|jgi:hypothetical protein
MTNSDLATEPHADWTPTARIGFRFLFAYIVLFYLTFSAFFAPFALPVALMSQAVWGVIVPWVATAILSVPPPPMVTDGDGLAQWIQMSGCGLLAVLATLIWSYLDRRRTEYRKLHQWLRVLGRYALGVAMITYGVAKIIHLQMLPPHLAKLVQPLGESSPTSLLWVFMGSSAAYSAFTGVVEFLGGVLLFNRRTTTLGALISTGAMVHVLSLNLAYDVSVKIWSMNLTVLALVLIAPDLRRLVDVLVRNRPSTPVTFPRLFGTEMRDRRMFRFGMVLLALTLAFRAFGFLNGRGSAYARTPTPVWGIHEVQSFMAKGEARPPLLTDTDRWRTVVIERSGLASIRSMDGSVVDYFTSVDTAASTVTFMPNPEPSITTAGATRWAYDPGLIKRVFEDAVEDGALGAVMLDYSLSNAGELSLSGLWAGDSIAVAMARVDESDFLLLTRGFHWVQDYPFFR